MDSAFFGGSYRNGRLAVLFAQATRDKIDWSKIITDGTQRIV